LISINNDISSILESKETMSLKPDDISLQKL
jgi:hypothetical protein